VLRLGPPCVQRHDALGPTNYIVRDFWRGEVRWSAYTSGCYCCWATPSLGQARAKYDKITDETTVSYFWLLDIPMFGPEKEVDLYYTFSGQARAAAPDTLLLLVTMKSHRGAGLDEGGWKLQRRPTLHLLVDDLVRIAFDVLDDDAKITSYGHLGHTLDETVAYTVPSVVVRQLASASSAAFSVGPWKRDVKPKELTKLRKFIDNDFLP